MELVQVVKLSVCLRVSSCCFEFLMARWPKLLNAAQYAAAAQGKGVVAEPVHEALSEDQLQHFDAELRA